MSRGKLNQGTQRASQVRVGVVIIVGLIVLAYGTFQVGRLFDVFASRYHLHIVVENSAGLVTGAAVTLAGQRVGQVDEIRFIPLERRVGERWMADEAYIGIRLAVNRAVQEQIRRDSEASLKTQGLLGDRYVEITPGSPMAPVLVEGDTLRVKPALDFERVFETAASALDDIHDMLGDLQMTTARLARGEGTVGALLTDDRLYERMVVGTDELARLLETLNRSDGTFARLIRDPAMYDRAETALARLDSLGAVILAGQGTLGRLMTDDSLYLAMLGVAGRVDTAMAEVEGIIRGVAEADGTIGRLLEDPALYDEFLKAVVDIQNLIQAIRDDPRRFRPEVRVRVF